MTKHMQVICLGSEPKYFCEGGWTLICCVARRAKSTTAMGTFASLYLRPIFVIPGHREAMSPESITPVFRSAPNATTAIMDSEPAPNGASAELR
jgi:hypothetical protein